MKVYVVVEDFDSGAGITSLNICNIFSTEKRANEKIDKLLRDYDYCCDDFRVEEWEVEE
jgi:hypothetical protein